MSNPNDNTIPNGNTVGETNSPETEAVIKRLGPDYNTIHKDTHKERKRTLTQTSDHHIIHADEEKSERISCIKDVFTKENLYEKLPITQWLPKYDISFLPLEVRKDSFSLFQKTRYFMPPNRDCVTN